MRTVVAALIIAARNGERIDHLIGLSTIAARVGRIAGIAAMVAAANMIAIALSGIAGASPPGWAPIATAGAIAILSAVDFAAFVLRWRWVKRADLMVMATWTGIEYAVASAPSDLDPEIQEVLAGAVVVWDRLSDTAFARLRARRQLPPVSPPK